MSPRPRLPALARFRLPASRRGRVAAAVAALVVVVLGLALTVGAASAGGSQAPVRSTNQFIDVPAGPGSAQTIALDTTLFLPPGLHGRAPALLVAHGFGATKDSVRQDAETYARHGYVVLTWSARGFGASGGMIELDQPDYEVADASALISWLAKRPEVQLDAPGDPRVGITGQSYGGALALLTAAYDPRVDAVAPQITWNDLADALLPNATGAGPEQGVFKKTWAGLFFSSGSLSGVAGGDPTCGRFAPDVCAVYQQVATTGQATPDAVALLRRASPSSVADRLKVPTLLVQGQDDSLFPLAQADATAQAVRHNGAPAEVAWIEGGHDGGDPQTPYVTGKVTSWFDTYLKNVTKGAGTGSASTPFEVTRFGGYDSGTRQRIVRIASGASYPGLGGTSARQVELTGGVQTVVNPAGGSPPSVSALPGIGLLSALGQPSSGSDGGGGFGGGSSSSAASGLGVDLGGLAFDVPGQSAVFQSTPLKSAVHVTGASTVRVHVSGADDIVLFAKLYDVSQNGTSVLPYQLAAPLRVTGASDGADVDVQLPAVDRDFAAGHRMRLVLTTTDLAYATPPQAAVYKVSLDGPLTVPLVPALHTAPSGYTWWTWGLPAGAVLAAALILLAGRRPTAHPAPDPALADTPLVIHGLTKRYKGRGRNASGRLAVDDLSFRVERGQVLGLLGPNGAGKTTTLRMLMGLIRPDAGEMRIFGHAVVPGAPVLSRLGSFVEGPGCLPHLSGRENLELYWAATGRPVEHAHVDAALEIAGLGDAIERKVRTYSQGMRQRLAIAQAMLGLPDLLVLDEPTNGLDPPQIHAMRDVLVRYAAGGRTVVVSSHLLAEVEQTCTHLVVMHRGRLVAAGPVEEITGNGNTLVVGTPVPEAAVRVVEALPGVESAELYDDSAGPAVLVHLAGAQPSAVVAELVGAGLAVDRVTARRRLEDAFLTLIGEHSS